MTSNTKRYLGDAVYVDVDYGDIILTTENGISTTNRIVLEPEVWQALKEYVESLERREGGGGRD